MTTPELPDLTEGQHAGDRDRRPLGFRVLERDFVPSNVVAFISERDEWPPSVAAIQFTPEGMGAARRPAETAATEEIATPQIAAAQQEAADRVAEVEAAAARAAERAADLEAELRRQVAHVERRRNELAWVARDLPTQLRLFVLRDYPGRHLYPQPSESFAAAVDQAAAELGLTPYAQEAR